MVNAFGRKTQAYVIPNEIGPHVTHRNLRDAFKTPILTSFHLQFFLMSKLLDIIVFVSYSNRWAEG